MFAQLRCHLWRYIITNPLQNPSQNRAVVSNFAQIAAAIVSIAVKNEGARGYTSFVLLILELNLIVWVGYYSDCNAGNAVKELKVCASTNKIFLDP